jgi:hypothetical protein
MQKGTTSKGMEANKNFAKWLSCGIQISGTFGLHHVYVKQESMDLCRIGWIHIGCRMMVVRDDTIMKCELLVL